MKILIVEDSDSIAKMIEVLVSARGYAVARATSGATALELLRDDDFALVLLDLTLPGSLDGFAICERIRADPRLASLTIFVLSAHSDDEHQQRAIEAGATAFYSKPFSPLALLGAIDALDAKLAARR